MPAFAAVVRSVRDEHGSGVLLIDHNVALIMEVCDRVHVLDRGRTLAEGTPEEIRRELRRRDRLPRRRHRGGGGRRWRLSRCSSSRPSRCATARFRRVRDLSLRLDARRDRRADRPERRRQVDDAGRGHGAGPALPRRDPPARRAPARERRSRSRAPASRSSPRGATSSPRSPSRRTCASGSPAGAAARGSQRDLAWVHEPLPGRRRVRATARPGRSRAASSSSSRSRAPSSPHPTCCCSTSPRSGSRRPSSRPSSRRSRRSASTASRSSSSSSAARSPSPSPTARSCSRTPSCA